MQDDVDAPGKGAQQRGRREGGVGGQDAAARARDAGEGLEVARLAGGVERRLDVQDVARAELGEVGGREGQLLQAGQLGEQADDAVAAVVAAADGDAAGVEEDEERVEGGQARGVGKGRSAQERGE